MNKRLEPVTYRRFQADPLLSEGLLAVARDNGDLERRVAQGMARMANAFGERADRQAQRAGALAGARDAMAGAPTASTVTGGEQTGGEQTGEARPQGLRVGVPPDQIQQLITQSARRHGVDAHALSETARLESGYNPNARNPASSAGGLFQFVDGTARQYGVSDKFDPAQSTDAAARLMKDNAATLSRTLGRAPTAGELYLAHQQGAGGASKLLSNPSALAVDVVGADA
ncbi:MAG TPA: transglycosylase SLT domain-containing protein, partial [Rhizomicrobium sp.]|nr:transglycosylase SLT domain-containing protein [Rhizomicrobium sp.]